MGYLQDKASYGLLYSKNPIALATQIPTMVEINIIASQPPVMFLLWRRGNKLEILTAETIEAHLPSTAYWVVNGVNTRGGDIFNLLKVSGSGAKVLEAGQCKKTEYLNSSSLWNEVKKPLPRAASSTSQMTLILPSTALHSL